MAEFMGARLNITQAHGVGCTTQTVDGGVIEHDHQSQRGSGSGHGLAVGVGGVIHEDDFKLASWELTCDSSRGSSSSSALTWSYCVVNAWLFNVSAACNWLIWSFKALCVLVLPLIAEFNGPLTGSVKVCKSEENLLAIPFKLVDWNR